MLSEIPLIFDTLIKPIFDKLIQSVIKEIEVRDKAIFNIDTYRDGKELIPWKDFCAQQNSNNLKDVTVKVIEIDWQTVLIFQFKMVLSVDSSETLLEIPSYIIFDIDEDDDLIYVNVFSGSDKEGKYYIKSKYM